MATPLDCDDSAIGTETLLRGCFVRNDDGKIAIRAVVVPDGDALDCDDTALGTETLLRSSIVRVGVNQYAIQIVDT
ncbi:MAG: hypothetical protein WAT41_10695 [Flavobacteriales bacterium]|jgi:hypothetical protein